MQPLRCRMGARHGRAPARQRSRRLWKPAKASAQCRLGAKAVCEGAREVHLRSQRQRCGRQWHRKRMRVAAPRPHWERRHALQLPCRQTRCIAGAARRCNLWRVSCDFWRLWCSCVVCGKRFQENVAALGHSSSAVQAAPACGPVQAVVTWPARLAQSDWSRCQVGSQCVQTHRVRDNGAAKVLPWINSNLTRLRHAF